MITLLKTLNLKKHAIAGLLLMAAGAACAQDRIVVFAAASLTNALSEVSAKFEQGRSIEVTHSFASSATLAKQIEAGAPADIFISANEDWMDYLQARGRIDSSSRKVWLGNRLVLVVPNGKSFPVRFEHSFNFADAFKGRLCAGSVQSVPAGIYAKQALTHFGWWGSLKQRLVETQDVRATLAFVERGECAAGIVYESDVHSSDKVQIAGVFPEHSHASIVYAIAWVSGTQDRNGDYWQFLQSKAAQAVFEKHGFRLLK